jgi:hypothetical protein
MNTDDPIALIEQLDAPALRNRILELDRQRQALIILLRAASARGRSERSSVPLQTTKGVRHAD